MSRNHFKINKGLSIGPVSSRPSDPELGDIIYNSTTGKLERYEAGTWQDMVSTAEVSLKYVSTSGPTIGVFPGATYVYGTVRWDTHNAYNPATGVFTAPSTGRYEFNASVQSTGVAFANDLFVSMVSPTETTRSYNTTIAGSANYVKHIDTFSLNSGDQVTIVPYQGASSAGGTDSSLNVLTIKKLK